PTHSTPRRSAHSRTRSSASARRAAVAISRSSPDCALVNRLVDDKATMRRTPHASRNERYPGSTHMGATLIHDEIASGADGSCRQTLSPAAAGGVLENASTLHSSSERQ